MSTRQTLSLGGKRSTVAPQPITQAIAAQANQTNQTPLIHEFIENYQTIISTLSPVHIGCGEDFEPTNYVIDGETLHHFNESILAQVLTDKDREDLLRLIDSNNSLINVQKFIHDKRKQLIATGKTQTVSVAPSVTQKYNNSIGRMVHQGNRAINALEIERTSTHPHTGFPYLPGSSIKGAIRTALLNSELQKRADLQGRQHNKNQAKDIEKDLFNGSFNTDPMRLIKITDANYQLKEGRASSRVCWQVNQAKKQLKEGQSTRASIKTLLQAIPEKQGMNFRGSLTLQHTGHHTEKTPSIQYSRQKLVEACNNYYLKEWQKESDLIEKLGYVNKDWLRWMKTMLAPEGSFGKLIAKSEGMLLRVGKHSGAESITLDDIASIKIMGAQGAPARQLAYSTTLWLASEAQTAKTDMLPFGWIFVQVKAI
jgi:CRISPR-associated protein Csm5